MATYRVRVEGRQYEVLVTDIPGGGAEVLVEGKTFTVEPVGVPPGAASPSTRPAHAAPAAMPAPRISPTAAPPTMGGSGHIEAPIPGVVTKVLVKIGETITAGQVVLKLEAMKMENDINSPIAGTVKEILASEGAEVRDGQLLVVVE